MTATRDILNAKLREIVKLAIVEPLAPHGFRQRNFEAWRRVGPVVHLVCIHRFFFNMGDVADFTFDCRIFVHGLLDLLLGQEMPARPSVFNCLVSERLGPLGPERRDAAWTIRLPTMEADAEMARADIAERIRRDFLPWVERYATLDDVARGFAAGTFAPPSIDPRYKSPPPLFGPAAVAYLLAGDHAEARRWAERIPEGVNRVEGLDELVARRDRLLAIIDAAERGEPLPLPKPASPAGKRPAARRGKP